MQDGTVRSLEIDLAHRTLVVEVEFAELVQREMFSDGTRVWSNCCSVWEMQDCSSFFPRAANHGLLPGSGAELKRRDASLNGFLKDSKTVLEGKALTITLSHGGYEALSSRHIDRENPQADPRRKLTARLR